MVRSIDAAPDGAPYVVVSFASSNDMKEGQPSSSPSFGAPKMMGFTNMGDMMEDLNKMLTGMKGGAPGVTSIKLDMHEYKQMDLSVGDRVFIDITRAESLGV